MYIMIIIINITSVMFYRASLPMTLILTYVVKIIIPSNLQVLVPYHSLLTEEVWKMIFLFYYMKQKFYTLKYIFHAKRFSPTFRDWSYFFGKSLEYEREVGVASRRSIEMRCYLKNFLNIFLNNFLTNNERWLKLGDYSGL